MRAALLAVALVLGCGGGVATEARVAYAFQLTTEEARPLIEDAYREKQIDALGEACGEAYAVSVRTGAPEPDFATCTQAEAQAAVLEARRLTREVVEPAWNAFARAHAIFVAVIERRDAGGAVTEGELAEGFENLVNAYQFLRRALAGLNVTVLPTVEEVTDR